MCRIELEDLEHPKELTRAGRSAPHLIRQEKGIMPCDFSYDHYREIIETAKRRGYRVMQMREYARPREDSRILLLRHDIDIHPKCAERLARFERDLGVRSTYFVRVHTNLYNPFSYDVYPLLRKILEMEHEIGLHFENVDFSHTTGEDASLILRREIDALQAILGVKITGMAAHRDLISAVSNDGTNPSEYGLAYEARAVTNDCMFVSDSLRQWTRTEGRCVCRVLQDTHLDVPRICLLTHPEFWYERPSGVQHL